MRKQLNLSIRINEELFEKIENEYDLKCYYEALEEYKKNPKTYTMKDVKKELGLE